MQAGLIAPGQVTGPSDRPVSRILLIEPDDLRAGRLRRILGAHLDAELHVAGSAPDALRAMRECLPDLVLTSTFLPPSVEALISGHLRRTSAAAHVQIVDVPPFISEDTATPGSSRRVLTFLGRQAGAAGGSACGIGSLIQDITTYLDQGRVRRDWSTNQRAASTALVPRAASVLLPQPMSSPQFGGSGADDRRRSRRRQTGDLPWLSAVHLPWGTEVKVLDISKSGVLLESPLRLVIGSTLDLQLVGVDGQVLVPARMLRSEVAGVDGLGVRYRAAAAFVRDLQIPGLLPDGRVLPSPRALADVLSRVMADVGVASSADLRARFERELRELLPVRDVQLRMTPVIERFGTDSVIFTVPRAGGPAAILQVTFHRDYKPSLVEFRLLRAAASVAAVLLQFAPLEHPTTQLTQVVSLRLRESRW